MSNKGVKSRRKSANQSINLTRGHYFDHLRRGVAQGCAVYGPKDGIVILFNDGA